MNDAETCELLARDETLAVATLDGTPSVEPFARWLLADIHRWKAARIEAERAELVEMAGEVTPTVRPARGGGEDAIPRFAWLGVGVAFAWIAYAAWKLGGGR